MCRYLIDIIIAYEEDRQVVVPDYNNAVLQSGEKAGLHRASRPSIR